MDGDEFRPQPYTNPWSPRDCEAKLFELMQLAAHAELRLRAATDQHTRAKLELERTHLIATTDPRCPRVERGGATVAERDDWIRGQELDEYEWEQTCATVVKHCQRYQQRISEQISIVQSMTKLVAQSYDVIGARGTGGR